MDPDAPATTPAEASAAATEATVVFRGKKRKLFRQKPVEDAPTTQTNEPAVQTEQESLPTDETPKTDEEGLSVAEIIRQRNARKHRLKGVGFGADDTSAAVANADDELSLMIREEEQKAMDLSNGGVNRRFTAQTGLSSDLVNKHMMEFIESEITKRKSTATSDHGSSTLPAPSSEVATTTTDKKSENSKHVPLQSKLQEIDLGDEVRSRNEALTELARRKLQGEVIEDEQTGRPKKIRLGRDGKPWRPRNRRTSDDIKRDQLVEEIMRENRLDVYETPTPPAAATPGADDDGAADDRIAEEFKREFMEAMAERQQKKRPAATAKKDSEDVLKGPKLGGSRNSRAAMRDLMLKKEKESKR
ncbi:hypothetical protein PFICI_00005 [Pestalotiopsis fici W106-1]|uniref:Uncharacterized protein n=1 Tax=Pestalotiopsis fici (strain W106-1 / CGMCC3.15140) TaxID=1229662 RepID=W3XL25_PESFW|nr:uncharacterized protein PFICI_00005 [Pestalotiopsis fici W106-1]ETS86177.1 hypothetical protein PFICI_00005 [Pestalotiopsis fici W106-1]